MTGTSLHENVDDTIARMNVLRVRGVSFALDDFGTGYSSLAYLRRSPFDTLTIDLSFVQDQMSNQNDAVIACTITAPGRSLGLRVLAEGVETLAERDFLFEHGWDAYQGSLCAPALPADAVPSSSAGNAIPPSQPIRPCRRSLPRPPSLVAGFSGW